MVAQRMTSTHHTVGGMRGVGMQHRLQTGVEGVEQGGACLRSVVVTTISRGVGHLL